MTSFRILTAATAISSLLYTGAGLASSLPVFPDSEYDPSVARVNDVLDYPLASRISSPAAIEKYFETLAEQHPGRIKLIPYGESWEGRPLFYAVISSAQNISRLGDYELNMRQLADPRTLSDSEAARIIDETPASVWIASSVHGNEISPAEAAMATAYHLLADQSEHTSDLMENTIVYLDPVQNPDGRARFVSRYYATVGIEPSADRLSAEHNEPWPNGRTNHYLFDMNRDWLALTQPETRGRIAALLQTYPLLFVDSHEMGGDATFYFTPEAHPYNPHITAPQRETLEWVGRNNAVWFDAFGYEYFTREIFDAFYPGYGASWPIYHGSISMTYEMGSARGHHFRTRDGEILTYGDGVQRNFIAFMSTIETAAQRDDELQQRFYDYRKNAVEQGSRGDVRSYILPARRDAAGHHKLVSILTEQGIEVQRADDDFRACGSEYNEGAYIIPAAQPTYHLIRTLLDDQVPMDDEFIEEQQRLRANNLPDQIYDVTAWSLPMMFNLDVNRCNRAPQVTASLVQQQERVGEGVLHNSEADFGFIVPWGDMSAVRLLTGALDAGLRVRSSDLPFTGDDGQRYPAGSLIVSRAGNPDDLNDVLETLARESGATVHGIDSSWVTDGPNFGSGNMKLMHKPNVAMLWDEPASVLSAGSTRYIIEQEANYPVTAIRPAQLRNADLSHYQVLLLPSTSGGSYEEALGEGGRENLSRWVDRGGVLITLGNATRFAIEGEQALLSSALERRVHDEQVEEREEGSRVRGEIIANEAHYHHRIQDAQADPDWVSGVLAQANVDQEHWLTAGVPENVNSIYVGRDIYTPLTIQNGRNVVSFAGYDDVLASGFLWDENRQQIAHKPLLMVQPKGSGMVISFTQEPNFRAYVDGMHLLMMNAIFRGAAHATPLR